MYYQIPIYNDDQHWFDYLKLWNTGPENPLKTDTRDHLLTLVGFAFHRGLQDTIASVTATQGCQVSKSFGLDREAWFCQSDQNCLNGPITLVLESAEIHGIPLVLIKWTAILFYISDI